MSLAVIIQRQTLLGTALQFQGNTFFSGASSRYWYRGLHFCFFAKHPNKAKQTQTHFKTDLLRITVQISLNCKNTQTNLKHSLSCSTSQGFWLFSKNEHSSFVHFFGHNSLSHEWLNNYLAGIICKLRKCSGPLSVKVRATDVLFSFLLFCNSSVLY